MFFTLQSCGSDVDETRVSFDWTLRRAHVRLFQFSEEIAEFYRQISALPIAELSNTDNEMEKLIKDRMLKCKDLQEDFDSLLGACQIVWTQHTDERLWHPIKDEIKKAWEMSHVGSKLISSRLPQASRLLNQVLVCLCLITRASTRVKHRSSSIAIACDFARK